MYFASSYFRRQKEPVEASLWSPSVDPGIIVVIPCFDEPQLPATLDSLFYGIPTEKTVGIILVFNYPSSSTSEVVERHKRSIAEAQNWVCSHQNEVFRVEIIDLGELPDRVSGVGAARKKGMDVALYHFASRNDRRGIIASMDADVHCDPFYLSALERHYKQYPKLAGCTVYFEHPLEGEIFPGSIYLGITQYEIHLRYHVQALRYTGFPYAFHTLGSCFAVTAETYAAQGGMNKRKAGEDFYFLQKVIPNGYFRELNSVILQPSPRPSSRVIFGTGPRMDQWFRSGEKEMFTYRFSAYEVLKKLFSLLPQFYRTKPDGINKLLSGLDPDLQSFLHTSRIIEAIEEINNNVSGQAAFRKRFFKWFDSLQVVRFLNYKHNAGLEKQSVHDAAIELLQQLGEITTEITLDRDILDILRKMERRIEYETVP